MLDFGELVGGIGGAGVGGQTGWMLLRVDPAEDDGFSVGAVSPSTDRDWQGKLRPRRLLWGWSDLTWPEMASKVREMSFERRISMSHDTQAGGKKVEGDHGDARAQASGPGDNPATGGSVETQVNSKTPENAVGEVNPSAPGETGTTPGTHTK
jgi:hypothetical protein